MLVVDLLLAVEDQGGLRADTGPRPVPQVDLALASRSVPWMRVGQMIRQDGALIRDGQDCIDSIVPSHAHVCLDLLFINRIAPSLRFNQCRPTLAARGQDEHSVGPQATGFTVGNRERDLGVGLQAGSLAIGLSGPDLDQALGKRTYNGHRGEKHGCQPLLQLLLIVGGNQPRLLRVLQEIIELRSRGRHGSDPSAVVAVEGL